MIEIPSDLHPDLVPLAFLLGNWEGAGVFDFPGAEKCNFGQEVTFTHDGRPFLEYVSHTWVLDDEGEQGPPAGDRERLLAHRRRPQGRGGHRPATRASSRSGTASSPTGKPQIDLVTDAVARLPARRSPTPAASGCTATSRAI